MLRKSILVLSFMALLGGCASQSVYKPAERSGAEGYTETKLSENRYRVSFNGNESTGSGKVQDYALLRAAELTLQNGYDWFELANKDIEKKQRQQTSVDSGLDVPRTTVYQSCGLLTCRTAVAHSPGYGVGVATTTTRTEYSAQLEVVMGKNPKPSKGDAYDAREVASTLRADLIKTKD